MLKLKMMLCVMMLPLVVSRLHIKAVWSVMREATTPPAWIMQPPPTGRHCWNGIISPQREADQCKNNWEGTQKYINEQCR